MPTIRPQLTSGLGPWTDTLSATGRGVGGGRSRHRIASKARLRGRSRQSRSGRKGENKSWGRIHCPTMMARGASVHAPGKTMNQEEAVCAEGVYHCNYYHIIIEHPWTFSPVFLFCNCSLQLSQVFLHALQQRFSIAHYHLPTITFS